MTSRKAFAVVSLLMTVIIGAAQTPPQKQTLAVSGYSGQATVIQSQGHAFVDVQDLAQLMNASLTFQRDRIVLTLPRADAPSQAAEDDKTHFSRGFMRAAIEAMASLREWGGTLQVVVQNGYPVGNTMAGNTLAMLQGRASDSVALASVAASTDADNKGLELLRNELNNVQTWSDRFIKARNSMSTGAISATTLNDDQDAQKILHCGQFLAQTFAGGTFQDDVTCH